MALVDRSNATGAGWGNEGETSRLKVYPVYSAQAYAERINFGKVRRVTGRRIEVDIELPSAEEIAQFKAKQSASQPQANVPESQPPSPSPGGSNGSQAGSNSPSALPSASQVEASILVFRWLDVASDRISAGGATEAPDGAKDQHLLLELELPAECVIEEMVVTAGERNRWVTKPNVQFWCLAVYQGESVAYSSRNLRG